MESELTVLREKVDRLTSENDLQLQELKIFKLRSEQFQNSINDMSQQHAQFKICVEQEKQKYSPTHIYIPIYIYRLKQERLGFPIVLSMFFTGLVTYLACRGGLEYERQKYKMSLIDIESQWIHKYAMINELYSKLLAEIDSPHPPPTKR